MTGPAAELLARALALPPQDPARPLLVAAAINEALGRSYIIVGGVAVDLHTGAYHPTDIDLIGDPLGPGDTQAAPLRSRGLSDAGLPNRCATRLHPLTGQHILCALRALSGAPARTRHARLLAP